MKLHLLTVVFCAVSQVLGAPSIERDTAAVQSTDFVLSGLHTLEKRKGGGGGGGGGRGGGSSSSGGRSSGGSSSGGSSRGGSGRTYSYQSESNAGGKTISGSGTRPSYGNRYAGGSTVPYTAGGVSPVRRIAPFLLPIAAVGLIFPALWLYPVYAYPYPIGYSWIDDNARRITSNVTCLCQEYSVCGCDYPENDNATAVAQLVTNGGTGGPPVNSTKVRTILYPNGTYATYINGTLDNGTTAAGGTDPSNDSQVSPAAKVILQYAGYWVMGVTVLGGVLMV